MSHVYRKVNELEGKPRVDGGQCVRLVQHYTSVGHTSTWRPAERVLDATQIEAGTVIANFDRSKRWPNKSHGNHAALFVAVGPRGQDGKPMYIVMMDQWTAATKKNISSRSVLRRGPKLHSEGNPYDDSDNAEHFYIVQ